MHVAFVLTHAAGSPSAAAISKSFRSIAPAAPPFVGEATAKEGVITLSGKSGSFFVSPMPAPVPGGEAESAARFSLGYFGRGQTIGAHAAHLIVAFSPAQGQTRFEELQAFARILAAVVDASHAMAVYWGTAGATHPADFFLDMAKSLEAPMPIWNGVSMARTRDRISFLSLGMSQLGLDDLLLTAPSQQGNDALAYFFDLLAYVARRGEPIADGETVGRTADEKARVRYEKSPVDPEKRVFCVDLE